MTVKFGYLSASEIFNLTNPRYLPHLALNWLGKDNWHSKRYEPLRDVIEEYYITTFDQYTNHYTYLRESIKKSGIQNPVVLSYGGLNIRHKKELPPDIRKNINNTFFSEHLGGSRIIVAKEMDINIPCIINDIHDTLITPSFIQCYTSDDVLSYFKSKPKHFHFNIDHVDINFMTYTHLPEETRYDLRHQSKIRKKVLREINQIVSKWLYDND